VTRPADAANHGDRRPICEDERTGQPDRRGRSARPQGRVHTACGGRAQPRSGDRLRPDHGDPRSATDGTDAYLRIYNNDGSEAGACGNGTRCVVQALAAETGKTAFTFQTVAGLLDAAEQEGGMVSVDMGRPRFRWDQIPLEEEFADTTGIELQIGPIDAPVLHTPSVASMGNPHAVFWVDRDVWSYDLERFGPLLENHPIFPDRANITIARVIDPEHIVIRTWERGAGLTKACGSGACAALVCAARKGLTGRSATVTVPGGDLLIEWREDDHVIIVTGCAAQTETDTFSEMNEVDLVLGNTEKLERKSYADVAAFGISETEKVRVNDIMSVEETAGHLIDGLTGRARAFRSGPERLRSPLHLLHHPLWPRQFPFRADGRCDRSDQTAGRQRLQRNRPDRRRHHVLWARICRASRSSAP
jgi:diaminopimelate epimerase